MFAQLALVEQGSDHDLIVLESHPRTRHFGRPVAADRRHMRDPIRVENSSRLLTQMHLALLCHKSEVQPLDCAG
jgi:hypothetical protein